MDWHDMTTCMHRQSDYKRNSMVFPDSRAAARPWSPLVTCARSSTYMHAHVRYVADTRMRVCAVVVMCIA